KIIKKDNDKIKITLNPAKVWLKTLYYLSFLCLYFLAYFLLQNSFEHLLFLVILIVSSYFILLKYNTTTIVINHEKFILTTYPLPRIWGYKQDFLKIDVHNVFVTKEVSEQEDNEIVTAYCLYLSTTPTRFMNLSFNDYHNALTIKNVLVSFWKMTTSPVKGEYIPS
ncbi:MAG: hypothetical protein ACOVQA_08190, partial [Thermoflexibacteraceae bacterium]